MLMVCLVLMALIDSGRTKACAATRWLWLFLSGGLFVAAPIGCDVPKDASTDVRTDFQAPEYGPPDAWDPGWDAAPGDTSADDVPQVLYGPPPDARQDPGPTDVPQVLYGPPPDVVEDATWPGDAIQPLYGPMQTDVPKDAPADQPQVLYGPMPV